MNESANKACLTVVIPTLGRPILEQTLASLARAAGSGNLEVVVVGRIEDDALAARVRSSGRSFRRFEHVPLWFETGDSSRKKNAGLEMARTDVVAFIDDDVVVGPEWPLRILEPFADAAVGMVSGPSLVPKDLPLVARLSGLALASRAAGYVSERYRLGHGGARAIRWSRIIGCNMAFRRSVLQGVGGFDPRFWPGEEMAAAYGAAKRGCGIVFQPAAWVHHYPRATFAGFIRQIHGYGATRVRLIRSGLECEPTTLAPAIMVAGAAVLCGGALFSALAARVLFAAVALYALAAIAMTIEMLLRTKRLSDVLLLGFIPIMHTVYGLAEWREFLRPNQDWSGKV